VSAEVKKKTRKRPSALEDIAEYIPSVDSCRSETEIKAETRARA
jgi:hypothetical protein